MSVDFGRTARDYARYRTAFPPELFARLRTHDIGRPGQRVADLGAGTGVLARGFAAAGCVVTGLDIAPEMLEQARTQDAQAGVEVTYLLGPAEDTGLPEHSFEVVSAGQAWHWFDRPRAAAEARRLLVEEGALVICYRDYADEPGTLGAASEALIVAYNPTWPLAKANFDAPEWTPDLTAAGFGRIETFRFTVDVQFSHEQWRGRMRSSNGVGASLSEAEVAAFDADLTRLLHERFPEPLAVPHHIWGVVARQS